MVGVIGAPEIRWRRGAALASAGRVGVPQGRRGSGVARPGGITSVTERARLVPPGRAVRVHRRSPRPGLLTSGRPADIEPAREPLPSGLPELPGTGLSVPESVGDRPLGLAGCEPVNSIVDMLAAARSWRCTSWSFSTPAPTSVPSRTAARNRTALRVPGRAARIRPHSPVTAAWP